MAEPTWVRCDMCEDFLCTVHGGHAHDCECPVIDEWAEGGYSPYDTPVTDELIEWLKHHKFKEEDDE